MKDSTDFIVFIILPYDTIDNNGKEQRILGSLGLVEGRDGLFLRVVRKQGPGIAEAEIPSEKMEELILNSVFGDDETMDKKWSESFGCTKDSKYQVRPYMIAVDVEKVLDQVIAAKKAKKREKQARIEESAEMKARALKKRAAMSKQAICEDYINDEGENLVDSDGDGDGDCIGTL